MSTAAAAAVKLSPALKSLIAAPHALGSALPAPSPSVTTLLFDRIRSRGEGHGGVGRETWLCLSTAALFTLNSPDAVRALYSFATEGDKTEEKVRAAAIMRETGLKCISFNGIPRTINNLAALRSHLSDDVKAGLSTESTRTPTSVETIAQRARALWDDIYEPHSVKLLSRLSDSHPDLPVHILNSHYGPLLSDPFPTSPRGGFKIGRVLTSVVAMSCLRAQTGVGPQVTSHVFGLKKALVEGGGAHNEEPLKGQEWLGSDEGIEWVLSSVDDVSSVVGQGRVSFGEPMLAKL